ncbi:MAG: molecular chaperone TorD family protein [Dehalococcoidia bacterium]|nr:molecular chaperone TorD family protein [Dehalococcoidia bacterium]
MVSYLATEGVFADLGRMMGIPVRASSQPDENWPEDHGALVQDFNDLFAVPLGRYVTPYESVFQDEREIDGVRIQGLLVGEATLDVMRLYREAGAAIGKDYLDLPDNVGLEFAFMEFLCRREQETRGEGGASQLPEVLMLQRRFLEDHLARWVPQLCDRILENAQTAFYKTIASLAQAFIYSEEKTLKQALAS